VACATIIDKPGKGAFFARPVAENKFAADSLLEREGFEPPVPLLPRFCRAANPDPGTTTEAFKLKSRDADDWPNRTPAAIPFAVGPRVRIRFPPPVKSPENPRNTAISDFVATPVFVSVFVSISVAGMPRCRGLSQEVCKREVGWSDPTLGARDAGLIRHGTEPKYRKLQLFLGLAHMRDSETQKGSLRKRNLPRPSTLSDLRPALVEYRKANELWAQPGSMVLVDVRALDGQPVDPGEYWLHIEEDGFYPNGADIPFTLENGVWERR
jgi:hypothetical protein